MISSCKTENANQTKSNQTQLNQIEAKREKNNSNNEMLHKLRNGTQIIDK